MAEQKKGSLQVQELVQKQLETKQHNPCDKSCHSKKIGRHCEDRALTTTKWVVGCSQPGKKNETERRYTESRENGVRLQLERKQFAGIPVLQVF